MFYFTWSGAMKAVKELRANNIAAYSSKRPWIGYKVIIHDYSQQTPHIGKNNEFYSPLYKTK
jgi:hypothetical protein